MIGILLATLMSTDGGARVSTLSVERPGRVSVVNDTPGDQQDAHLWGDWIAYSSERPGGSELRFHNLATGSDRVASEVGAMDFVTDFQEGVAVATHLTPTGSAVVLYKVGEPGPPSEVAPQAGSNRRAASMGAHTLVWQDYGFSANLLEPELVAYDLQRQSLTRLTSDDLLDKDAEVSPDGNAIVWSKCDPASGHCEIWRALYAAGGWTSQAVTGSEGGACLPRTNGSLVAYVSAQGTGTAYRKTIAWQPLQGGAEQVLEFAGESSAPILRGDFIAFEHRDPAAPVPNWDLFLLDLREDRLYRLTDSAADEILEDVSAAPDGLVRVVFASGPEDYNLYALTFRPRSPELPTRRSLRLAERPGDQEVVLRGTPLIRTRLGHPSVGLVKPPSLVRSAWNCAAAPGPTGGPLLLLVAVGWPFAARMRRRSARVTVRR